MFCHDRSAGMVDVIMPIADGNVIVNDLPLATVL